MGLAEAPLVLVLLGLAAYTVLGGADFGAGLWFLLSGRGRDRDHRAKEPRRGWEPAAAREAVEVDSTQQRHEQANPNHGLKRDPRHVDRRALVGRHLLKALDLGVGIVVGQQRKQVW